MKRNLESFELSINEEIYLQGESLYDHGAVIDLQKGENNLFTAEVLEDGNTYEVEILSPASLQRKTTCDCKEFVNFKLCRHIVATLLSIRKKISQPRKKKSKSRKSKEDQFTTRSLLHTLDKEALKAFIQDYSKKDKKFDLFFKARFAKKKELKDNSIKYKSILDSLVPPAKDSNYRINKSSIMQINKFFNEFYVQVEDSLALHEYAEAFEIFAPVFKKIAYVRHYARSEDENLSGIDRKYHLLLGKLLASNAAPELIDQIITFVMSLASYSYYQIRDFKLNIPFLVFSHDKSHALDCSTLAYEKMGRTLDPLLFSLYMVFIVGNPAKLVFTDYYQDQQKLYKALKLLIDNGYHFICGNILEHIETLDWKNASFDELKLKLLADRGDYTDLIRFGIEKLIATQQFYYVKILLNHIPKKKYSFFLSSISKNKKHINSELLCKIYASLERDKELMTLLQEKEDLNLAMKYDYQLFNSQAELIEKFYLTSIEKYLTDHVGFEANKYVDSIIDHLNKINQKSVAKSLKKMIINKFPHRKRFLSSYR